LITAEDRREVQQLVSEQGNASRLGLARALCERWQWRTPTGKAKARSALAVLKELAREQWIEMPAVAASAVNLNKPRERPAPEKDPDRSWVQGGLWRYRPLRWELVRTPQQRQEWRDLLDRHHYLGAPELVGASLKYLVWSVGGQLLGAVGWQSAVRHLGCRDRLLGWDVRQRARWLDRVVNNVRLLVMPWVQVPNLASAMLSESIGVLQEDWPRHYGVAVWLAESFIDRQRFSGASYRAANWQAIGWTQGFARRQGRFVHHGQSKEVYVYVIQPRMRRLVHGDAQQPLLTRPYLLAQRQGELNQPPTKRTRMKEAKEQWRPKLPPTFELSVEDVHRVGQELSKFLDLFDGAFGRIEHRELCTLYVQGLLSDTQRKNVEGMALALAGPDNVRNLQRFVGTYRWKDAAMRRRHWELCAQSLSDPLGVWSLDASDFAKKGDQSVGVAPQYCGALGKTANCQSGVFICYSGPQGHVLLDARLYLPGCWFEPAWAQRRERCHIPKEVCFQTKPQLATDLLQTLFKTGLFAGRWVAMDCSFGNNEEFLATLPPKLYYLADIPATRKVWPQKASKRPQWETQGCTVEQLAGCKGLLNWQTHKVSEGEKGPIVAAFARIRVYMDAQRTEASTRWLLLRNGEDKKIKYSLSNAPEDIPMGELVRVSGARWPIERCFEEDKSELGLDHYEHRSWAAWHRHTLLVFLAQLFLVRLRHTYKKSPCTDPAPSAAAHRMESAQSNAGCSVLSGVPALP
jgi:SRSO17 transposase